MSKKLFYLTGFMGSGKSTIGPILANTLGWDFYDLDKIIEDKEGMKVSEIFAKKGEEYFRKVESNALLEISAADSAIISLGGGTVTIAKNIEVMKKSGWLLYLKISPQVAYERLRFKRDRPVLTRDGTVNLNKSEFINKLSRLMDDRKQFYEKADIIFDTNESSIGGTVDKLVKIIKKEIHYSNK